MFLLNFFFVQGLFEYHLFILSTLECKITSKPRDKKLLRSLLNSMGMAYLLMKKTNQIFVDYVACFDLQNHFDFHLHSL